MVEVKSFALKTYDMFKRAFFNNKIVIIETTQQKEWKTKTKIDGQFNCMQKTGIKK